MFGRDPWGGTLEISNADSATDDDRSRDLAQEGRTMVVVTHEMGFAREVSNQLVFLHKGIVEERGNPREVLVNPQSERLQQFLSGSLK